MTTPSQDPQAGIADAFGQLSEQTAALVRREIDAARTEMLGKLQPFAASAVLLGAAATAGVLAVASLHRAVLGTLERHLTPGTAGLLTATLYAGAAAGATLVAVQQIRRAPAPYPSETLNRTAEELRRGADHAGGLAP